MILRPSNQDLKTSIQRLEQFKTIGFENHSQNVFDATHYYPTPSISMTGPWRTYAKRTQGEHDYVGPIWAVESVVLLSKGFDEQLMNVIDALVADDMLGTPSRVEGWSHLKWLEKESAFSPYLNLRYDFLPEQLPALNGQVRDAPYVVKFRVYSPEHTSDEANFGPLGERASLLLFPPPAYGALHTADFAKSLGKTLGEGNPHSRPR